MDLARSLAAIVFVGALAASLAFVVLSTSDSGDEGPPITQPGEVRPTPEVALEPTADPTLGPPEPPGENLRSATGDG